MLQQDALNIARQYISNLNNAGIVIYKAWLFGSHAVNQASESSDIDILLVSDTFDTDDDAILSKPWSPKYRNDYRIKPVKREVFAAGFRDRIAHPLIFNYISPVFEKRFINDSYSYCIDQSNPTQPGFFVLPPIVLLIPAHQNKM